MRQTSSASSSIWKVRPADACPPTKGLPRPFSRSLVYPFSSANRPSNNLTDDTIHEASPDIVSDPGAHHYLIVWQEQYSNLSGPYGVSGRLIETDATMGNDFVIVAPYAGVERTEPAVAAGPPGYLVAWEHDRYGTSYTDIHGRLVWPAVVYLPLTVRNCIP